MAKRGGKRGKGKGRSTSITRRPAATRGRPGSAIARIARSARGMATPVRRRRLARYASEKTSDVLMSEGTSLAAHFLGNEMDRRLPKLMGVAPTWIGSAVAFLGAILMPRTWWKGRARHLSRKVLDGFLHSILGEQLHKRGMDATAGAESPAV